MYCGYRGRFLFAVVHAQSAAQIKMADSNTQICQRIHQFQQAVQGIDKRAEFGQLRADVAVQAHHLHVIQLCGALVNPQRLIDSQPELVLAQAGGDVRVGFRIHVGVDPDGDGRHTAKTGCDRVQHFQLRRGFQVEAVNAQLQGPGHFLQASC